MKWVRHFGDRSLTEIHDAAQGIRAKASKVKTRVPEDEKATRELQLLTRLNESFDREVDRCSWRLEGVPKETLQCLHGIQPGKPNSLPFGCTAKDKSRASYQSVRHRYLEFCWRAHEMGREEAATRLAMNFTDEQWSLMADVARELEDEQLGDIVGQTELHDNSGFFNGSDNISSESGSDKEEDVIETKALDQAVFRFIIASIKVRVGGDMYRNVMLCFCAATGIRRHPLGYMEAYLFIGVK
ncbi:hypothetical protein EDB80DRAFT_595230 [Ilyonectria destructans]|nr:hypothetical protein EDB80DRAFT_595230 [Ilyonectria destructans]